VKANICKEAPALAFRLEDADGVARVVWETDPVPGVTADVVLSGRLVLPDDDQQDATTVVRQLLADETWPLDARDALAAGRAHGIPDRTLRWTARRLGIAIRRLGFGREGRWLWHRPAIEATDTSTPTTPTSGPPPAPIEASATPIAATTANVCSVAPMDDLAPMDAPKGQVTAMAPIQKTQQNTHSGIGATRHTTRAREDVAILDDAPDWVTEPAEPDFSDLTDVAFDEQNALDDDESEG
jgi:hypothetical protein